MLENVWVISYDLLRKWKEKIQSKNWDILVYDESHYLKNPRAIRTKEAFKITAKKKLFLTGTPILSRPLDLYTTVNACGAPITWWDYVHRYCNAHYTTVYTKKGPKKVLDCTSSSHLEELHNRIHGFTIRRLKKDVLKELPPKVRQKIVLPSEKFKKEIAEERRIHEAYLHGGSVTSEARIAVAKAKLPQVIEHVRNILDQETKCVLYFYHHEIGNLLAEEFKDMNPALINGNISMEMRKDHLERYQGSSGCRLLLGSISTSVGYTATAGRVAVFCELDWVPANLWQAEDRLHRIGQEQSVLVQYLVLEDSVDDDIVTRLAEKKDVIEQVL